MVKITLSLENVPRVVGIFIQFFALAATVITLVFGLLALNGSSPFTSPLHDLGVALIVLSCLGIIGLLCTIFCLIVAELIMSLTRKTNDEEENFQENSQENFQENYNLRHTIRRIPAPLTV